MTRAFLGPEPRGDWQPLAADADAAYDEVVEIDLCALEPLVAAPSQPGQRGAGARGGGHAGGSGVHRQLHQLVLSGPDDRGRDPERQDGPSRVSLTISPAPSRSIP